MDSPSYTLFTPEKYRSADTKCLHQDALLSIVVYNTAGNLRPILYDITGGTGRGRMVQKLEKANDAFMALWIHDIEEIITRQMCLNAFPSNQLDGLIFRCTSRIRKKDICMFIRRRFQTPYLHASNSFCPSHIPLNQTNIPSPPSLTKTRQMQALVITTRLPRRHITPSLKVHLPIIPTTTTTKLTNEEIELASPGAARARDNRVALESPAGRRGRAVIRRRRRQCQGLVGCAVGSHR